MNIDITSPYRQYSPSELREYSKKGLLYAGDVSLSDFLDYFLEGMISKEEHLKIVDSMDSYWEGYEDGQRDAEEWGKD